MQIRSAWLSQLKTPQLHRLAVLLGTSCSGTKPVRIAAINNALSSHQRRTGDKTYSEDRQRSSSDHVSLVSIDMGIRNLAFAHLTAKLQPAERGEMRRYGPVTLSAWRKIDVSRSSRLSIENVETNLHEKVDTSGTAGSGAVRSEAGDLTVEEPLKLKDKLAESFDPAVYAEHAYNIVRSIVDRYKPTHIVIERQRFRSGGSSAVLEWTIRVGVFEGMLYAVLRTLYGIKVMNGPPPAVEGILPMRVNRFWLEDGHETLPDSVDAQTETKVRKRGKEVKKAKIEVVSRLLDKNYRHTDTSGKYSLLPLEPGRDVQDLVSYFRSEAERPENGRRKRVAGIARLPVEVQVSKLDDLADCLLQGLAWLNWQNNMAKIHGQGELAFDLAGEVVKVRPKARKSGYAATTT